VDAAGIGRVTAGRPAAAITGPVLAFAFALVLAACGAPARAPAGVRTSSPAVEAHAFAPVRQILLEGAPARERRDAAALRTLGPALTTRGIELLKARMPHDLRRADVAHFLEGRAAFGDALKAWAGAVEGSDGAALLASWDGLVEAYWAWVDAYRGLPPEHAV